MTNEGSSGAVLDRLTAASDDVVNSLITRLRDVLPAVFSDGRIDIDRLRRILGEHAEAGTERFGLQWPGKAECLKVIREPSIGTLRPIREGSVNPDTAEDVIVEGDNLEVLKLLQKSYHGKIKLIYIDPPYNTGREFIYPDDFREGLQSYLRYSGQVDGDGLRLSTNVESSGRFHSKWLSMMYPRLFLARNLLRDDGAIVISIDRHEVHHLLSIGNEIFGDDNLVGILVYERKSSAKGVPPANMLVETHEYLVCYQRSSAFRFVGEPRSSEGFANPDDDPRGLWRNTNCRSTTKAPSEAFAVIDPATERSFSDTWAHSRDEMEKMARSGQLIFPKRSEGQVRKKEYLNEFANANIPLKSFLGTFDAQSNTEALERLMGAKVFPNAKHVDLMKVLVRNIAGEQDVVLDFFAGSGTTAEAVISLNAADRKKRRFIVVQLPEPTFDEVNGREVPRPEAEAAFASGFRTIAALLRERVRRVLAATNDSASSSTEGFRSYRLTASNFLPWDGDHQKVSSVAATLQMFDDHLVPDRSAEDILTEILLKAGFPLTAPVETLTLGGKTVYAVAEGALLVCLDRALTLEVIEAMVAREPQQIVCLDAGFRRNDQLKVNAVQAIKARARSEQSTIVLRVV